MKQLLFTILLALLLSTAPALAETLYVYEDSEALIELKSEPCSNYVKETYIKTEYQWMFKSYTLVPKTRAVLEANGGKELVDGCWSTNPEIAPSGYFVWINEFGQRDFLSLEYFEKVKTGVEI